MMTYRRTVDGRHLAILSGLALVLFLSSCSYQTLDVHNADITALKEDRPASCAVVALLLQANFSGLSGEGSDVQRQTFSFGLGSNTPINTYAECPDVCDERKFLTDGSKSSLNSSRGFKKKAETLLEAYCTFKSNEDGMLLFEKQTTGLGRRSRYKRQIAVLDSTTMIAHAYIDRSLQKHLNQSKALGTMTPLHETAQALFDAPDSELYDRIQMSLMNEGVIEEADRLAACEILGVESLLVVAVSYDYMIVLHSSQYASWTSSAIRAETDVLVYNKSIDKPSATLQFQRVHEKHLKGLDDVGKLIKQGLDGHLKTDDYRRGL